MAFFLSYPSPFLSSYILMQEPSFREVFTKFLGESMTAEEIRLLCDYIRDSKNDPLLDELLETAYTNPSFSEAGDRNMEDALTEVLARLREREPGETAEAPAIHETPVISRHRIYWFRGIAAAAVIAGLIYGGIRLIGPGTARRQPLASARKKGAAPWNEESHPDPGKTGPGSNWMKRQTGRSHKSTGFPSSGWTAVR
jgi:hypothetical protein